MGLIYEGTSTKCGSWYFITKWTENKVEPFFYNTGVILYSLFKIKNPIYKYLSDIITMLTDQQKISFAMTNLGDQAIINMLIGMNQKISKKNVVLPLPPEFNWRQCNVNTNRLAILHGNGYKFFSPEHEKFWYHLYNSYFYFPKLPTKST